MTHPGKGMSRATMTIQELLRSLTPEVKMVQPSVEPATLDLSEPKVQKRCGSDSCKKKLLLSDITCTKCQTRFCSAHFIPEAHACSHDFRAEGQKLLAAQNPRVVNEKVTKI
jgi:hypothetical protein